MKNFRQDRCQEHEAQSAGEELRAVLDETLDGWAAEDGDDEFAHSARPVGPPQEGIVRLSLEPEFGDGGGMELLLHAFCAVEKRQPEPGTLAMLVQVAKEEGGSWTRLADQHPGHVRPVLVREGETIFIGELCEAPAAQRKPWKQDWMNLPRHFSAL